MENSNPNRRVFLATSATAAAVGAGIASDAQGAAAHPEVRQWTDQIGSRFQAGGQSLVLRSVGVTDHSADQARPRDVRPHTIELLFVSESGKKDNSSDLRMPYQSDPLFLSRIVPPEGETGAFYEGIIN